MKHLVVVLLALSCSPDRTNPKPDEAVFQGFDLRGYCAQVSGAACRLAQRCNNPHLFKDRHYTLAECADNLEAQCIDLGLGWVRGVEYDAIAYDGVAYRTCLDELANASCTEAVTNWGAADCFRTAAGWDCDLYYFTRSLSETCGGVFSGIVPEGETCYQDAECGAGYHCDEEIACPGRCKARLQLGEGCQMTPTACAEDLACSGESMLRCLPWAQEGEDCVTAGQGNPKAPCAPPLQCWVDPGQPHGTCRPTSGLHEPCGERKGPCQPDTYCAFKSEVAREGTCESYLVEDEPCNNLLGIPLPCGTGLHCFGDPVAVGRPGVAGQEGYCRPYPDQEGYACIRNDSSCVDHYCTAGPPGFQGQCIALKAVGEDCGSHQQCKSGLCAPNERTGTSVCTEIGEQILGCVRPFQTE